MTFVNNDTKIREIKQGDDDFFISDGVIRAPRAYIQISNECPMSVNLMIQKAIADGHLKTVACIKEKDYMWEKLHD